MKTGGLMKLWYLVVWYQQMLTILAFPIQHHCRNDQYWFEIYGNCEPCSRICDPPNFHENDCPERCPNYTPTTTTTPTPTANSTTPLSLRITVTPFDQIGQYADNGNLPSFVYVIIAIIIFVFISFLVIGCLAFKKRKPLKDHWLFRWCFKRAFFSVSFQPVQPDEEKTEPERDVDAYRPINHRNDPVRNVNGQEPEDDPLQDENQPLNEEDDQYNIINDQEPEPVDGIFQGENQPLNEQADQNNVINEQEATPVDGIFQDENHPLNEQADQNTYIGNNTFPRMSLKFKCHKSSINFIFSQQTQDAV